MNSFRFPLRVIILVIIAATALGLVARGTPAHALIAKTLNLSARDVADIGRIEKHLNTVKTMRARFLQVTSTGEYAEGLLLISRPGHMRLEYDPPNPTLVIADGANLIYVDRELEQATAVLLSLTPAELILRDNLSLRSNELLVTGFERSPGVIRISLVKSADPLEGRIMLIFSDKPLELRKWVVNDSQGVKTTVSLMGPEFGIKLDRKLFDYKMPDIEGDVN